MKKVLLPQKSILFHELVCLAFALILILSPTDMHNAPANTPKKIVTTNTVTETKAPHILTTKELSLLYSYKGSERKADEYEITVEDADMLMRIAVAEDNTDEYSQAYVMSVVLNRVQSDLFPNSVAEVIRQDGQFSAYSNGSFKRAVPDVNSHLALYLIESGQIKTEYLYFEAAWCKDTWQSSTRGQTFLYGGTRFYE